MNPAPDAGGYNYVGASQTNGITNGNGHGNGSGVNGYGNGVNGRNHDAQKYSGPSYYDQPLDHWDAPGRAPVPTPVLQPEYRYCRRCKIIKPARTHHCRQCGTCVVKVRSSLLPLPFPLEGWDVESGVLRADVGCSSTTIVRG